MPSSAVIALCEDISEAIRKTFNIIQFQVETLKEAGMDPIIAEHLYMSNVTTPISRLRPLVQELRKHIDPQVPCDCSDHEILIRETCRTLESIEEDIIEFDRTGLAQVPFSQIFGNPFEDPENHPHFL